MKPTSEQITALTKSLRATIDSSKDCCESRIAQAMETTLLWATEESDELDDMTNFPAVLSVFLRNDLDRENK